MGKKKGLFQRKSISLLVLILLASNVHSDDILISVDKHKAKFENVALQIWDYAELGYLEKNSSSLLASSLEDEGFTIKRGLAGIPSAFIAEFNNGGPVIGILGEFDARGFIHLDEFIHAPERGLLETRHEVRTDAEGVDFVTMLFQRKQHLLVNVVRRRDGNFAQIIRNFRSE